jgi:hypothetical protein
MKRLVTLCALLAALWSPSLPVGGELVGFPSLVAQPKNTISILFRRDGNVSPYIGYSLNVNAIWAGGAVDTAAAIVGLSTAALRRHGTQPRTVSQGVGCAKSCGPQGVGVTAVRRRPEEEVGALIWPPLSTARCAAV